MKNLGTVGIVGQGYVGLPLAIEACESGWTVVGIEVDSDKAIALKRGQSNLESVPNEKLQNILSTGRYAISSNFADLSKCQIIIVCVPTPLGEADLPDLTALRMVVDSIDRHASKGSLIINESTSFPGTLREIFVEPLEKDVLKNRFLYAVAPERIDPGNLLYSLRNTPRVIGALSAEAMDAATEFYSTFCQELITVSSPEVAELSKLLENSFRLVNISLVNQLSILAAKIGISTREVIEAAASKPFGFMAFYPGVGIGGHCIPVDPIYLSSFANTHMVNMSLIEEAKRFDDSLSILIARRIREIFPDLQTITVIGLAYKAGSKDLRNSPTIRLINCLREQGLKVEWIDSLVLEWNNEKSATVAHSPVAVYIHKDKSFNPDDYLARGGKILDFTGSLPSKQNVIQL